MLHHDTSINCMVRDALLRQDLTSFIAKSFESIDPSTEYLPNWHIDVIADHLERASRGEIKRLIINMPPRSLKSLCVSVAWPAWILGNTPSARVMSASYSLGLSIRHSMDCRHIMSMPWYRHAFPDVQLAKDQNEKHRFSTTEKGFRFATSVGGTATGEGGDILIVDDPHTPSQAQSKVQRERGITWFDQTFMSRLNHKKKGVIVVVMQRLHPEDLTGHLLQKTGQNWEQLLLPAVARQKEVFILSDGREYMRQENELLQASREGVKELDILRISLGSQAFAAQYQQQPLPEEGAMMRSRWIKRFNKVPDGMMVQSWDTAIKAGVHNDYSVCATWCIEDDAFYLVDMLAKRMEYPELRRAVIECAQEWKPDAILIEDKASGQSLLQDLKRETQLPLIAIRPEKNKQQRFAAVTPLFEAGKVYFPRYAAWLSELEQELLAFPQSAHDDRVDAVSQFLQWAKHHAGVKPRVRSL